MRVTSLMRHLEFGNLATVRGILTYRLSPFEQRAFGGAISHGVPNMIRRIRAKIFIVSPPFIWAYLLYKQNMDEYNRLCRKNPDDYKDDK